MEKNWNKWGEKRRKAWKCSECKDKGKHAGSSSEIITKLHTEFMEKMEKTIKEQFAIHSKQFTDEIEDFKKSLNHFSEVVDDFERKMSEYSDRFQCLEKANAVLVTNNKKLSDEVTTLRARLESIDQYNRNRNIELVGVPEVEGERVPEIVNKLSNLLNIPLDYASDVQAAHRVPTKSKTGVKPIIIQFTNRQTRDAVLLKAKSKKLSGHLKSTSFVPNAPSVNVYVNEHLTLYFKGLLFEAKKLKDVGYKYVWLKEGRVFARMSDSSRVIQILSMEDVAKLLVKTP